MRAAAARATRTRRPLAGAGTTMRRTGQKCGASDSGLRDFAHVTSSFKLGSPSSRALSRSLLVAESRASTLSNPRTLARACLSPFRSLPVRHNACIKRSHVCYVNGREHGYLMGTQLAGRASGRVRTAPPDASGPAVGGRFSCSPPGMGRTKARSLSHTNANGRRE